MTRHEGEERERADVCVVHFRGDRLSPLEHGAVVAVGEELSGVGPDGPVRAEESLRADEVRVECGDGTEHAASLHAVLGRDDLHRRVHGGGEEEERLEQSGVRAHGRVGLDRGDDGGGDLDHGLERYVHTRRGRQREGARAQEGLVLRRLLRGDLPHATVAVLPRRHQVPVENLGVLPEAEVET